MTDRYMKLMKKCFELAEQAKIRGDSAVGSLLVNARGEILSQASEHNRTTDVFAHAELAVIQAAVKYLRSEDLSGCVLFTTNEPCFLCSYAIRHTSISKVIYARETLEVGGFSSRYPILAANDITKWRSAPETICLSEYRG